MTKKTILALTVALTTLASSAYAVEPAWVDNTSFEVGALADATMAASAANAVPWVFQKDGTVSAKGVWKGVWASWPGSEKLVVTIMMTEGGATDTFEVTFLTPKWFVATKGGALYRQGKKK
jgi:hypothetical protein